MHLGDLQSLPDVRLFAATGNGRLWASVRVYPPPERFLPTQWLDVGQAVEVSAMTGGDGLLWVTTRNDRLWTRRPVLNEIPWTQVGLAPVNTLALTLAYGKLVAAAREPNAPGRLWVFDNGWRDIGPAVPYIVDITAGNGKLFAASSPWASDPSDRNRLWVRDAAFQEAAWQTIGHAIDVKGMTFVNGVLFPALPTLPPSIPTSGRLFAMTGDATAAPIETTDHNRVWERHPVLEEIDWRFRGHGPPSLLVHDPDVHEDDEVQSVVAIAAAEVAV